MGAALAADRAVPAAAVAASRRAARRGQAADRSAEAPTRSPRLAFGAVTNLCDATSALTVEGDLPSSLAISLHDTPRSSILWTVSRSCLVSLPQALGTALAGPLFFFPDMPSSNLPGPADPALRVSGSHIHPHMRG